LEEGGGQIKKLDEQRKGTCSECGERMIRSCIPRTTAQLFSEILAGAESELRALKHQMTVSEDHETPTTAEVAAVDRVQKIIRGSSALIKIELNQLG
jgi:hypothetical protein